MEIYEFGSRAADVVLLQPVDERDLDLMEKEVGEIRGSIGADFRLAAFKIDDWNNDLSPWRAPAVFGDREFGEGAEDTFGRIMDHCGDRSKTYFIGGYSLAGLFAIWAAYRTDLFRGVAAASPSMWFPGFSGHMKENMIKCRNVYLSLGDKEEKARNPVMAAVGDKTREAFALLKAQGVNCVLEWNEGNHFKDTELRTAKAFAWVVGQYTMK